MHAFINTFLKVASVNLKTITGMLHNLTGNFNCKVLHLVLMHTVIHSKKSFNFPIIILWYRYIFSGFYPSILAKI